MTKFVLELQDDKQAAVLRAILELLHISIIEEEKVEEEGVEVDPYSFYQQFQLDLTNFQFDRQEANER